VRMSRRRVAAVFHKELRDLRRSGNVVYAMVVLPLVFLIQPLIQIFAIASSSSPTLHREHTLIYLLAIPALVPAALAAYSIVGERVQGTLEPLLSTPVREKELIFGKALAVFLPSVAVAYGVFAVFIAIVEVWAAPGVASALVQFPDVVAQIVFTPLLVIWSIWLGMAISARSSDIRTAGQLSILVSLPTVAVTSLIAFNVIPADQRVALLFGGGLAILDRLGWRAASSLFNRERLITTTK